MTVGFQRPAIAARPLVGSWSLVAYIVQRAADRRAHPFGASPGGLLSYADDGAMSAHLVALDDRPARGSPRYVAYFGGYSVDVARTIVTHHVHASSDPALSHRALERHYHLEGDQLTLTAALPTATHALVWQRIGMDSR